MIDSGDEAVLNQMNADIKKLVDDRQHFLLSLRDKYAQHPVGTKLYELESGYYYGTVFDYLPSWEKDKLKLDKWDIYFRVYYQPVSQTSPSKERMFATFTGLGTKKEAIERAEQRLKDVMNRP